ncbi:7255_t:CDS:2, partial [Dentiscutata erythropus]
MLKFRFEELEKKNKIDTAKLTAENAELKDRQKGLLSIPSPIEVYSEKEKNITPSLTIPESITEPEISESSLLQDTINDDSIEILEFPIQNTSSPSDMQNEVNSITTPSILLTHISTHSVTASGNSEDMVSENDESLLETKISMHDDSLNSNLEPSDSDNENFSDNEDEYSFNKNIIFFDDEDEGYYYELSTGKTYRKSDHSIC